MLSTSLAVIVLGIGIGLVSFVFLGWALWTRQFDALESWAMIVFEDPEELRYARPWETPEQAAERQKAYGDLLQAERGEWGQWRDEP